MCRLNLSATWFRDLAAVGENDPVNAPRVDLPNVLAHRYASPEMVQIWSPEHKVVLERRLWIAVMRSQAALGIDVPVEAITAYESVVEQVD